MENYTVLKECALFRGIDETQLLPLMQCMNARTRNYQAEEYIFLSGNVIDYVGVILTGSIEIIKENLSGNKHIVAVLSASDLFAEGIVCTADRVAPVSVRAREAVQIVLIPYERVIKSCGNSCTFHIRLIQNMMVVLGEKNRNLNHKMELLVLKGMRDKLSSYLLSEAEKNKNVIFEIKLNRNELADYLNVARTSMCRELARMKEEALIDYYGTSFKLIDQKKLIKGLESR
jgi:CRP/FNR family transcriptional regulator, dissimilatory nitrate respiration regulator